MRDVAFQVGRTGIWGFSLTLVDRLAKSGIRLLVDAAQSSLLVDVDGIEGALHSKLLFRVIFGESVPGISAWCFVI